MIRAAAALLCCGLVACGGGPSSLQFGVTMDALVANDVGEFQVALLHTERRSCATFTTGGCLNANPAAPGSAFVPLYVDGRLVRAVRFAATTSAPSGQDVHVTADVGRDYLVIVEALNRDALPQLVGTSCTPLSSVGTGTTNIPANAFVIYSPYTACDPRFAP